MKPLCYIVELREQDINGNLVDTYKGVPPRDLWYTDEGLNPDNAAVLTSMSDALKLYIEARTKFDTFTDPEKWQLRISEVYY
jgi:hypothetical protein